VCVNGGQRAEVPGTWSATLEWLVGRLAPQFPEVRFVEVRYRIKSWQRLGECIDDCRAAIGLAGAEEVALLGFSMGGAVSIAVAGESNVEAVVGLAPWIPDPLDLNGLRGKRLTVIHGALDRSIPFIPGVSPSHSRRGYERARALGAEGRYVVVPGGLHGVAVRSRRGNLVTFPRASRWAEVVGEELERFASSDTVTARSTYAASG